MLSGELRDKRRAFVAHLLESMRVAPGLLDVMDVEELRRLSSAAKQLHESAELHHDIAVAQIAAAKEKGIT